MTDKKERIVVIETEELDWDSYLSQWNIKIFANKPGKFEGEDVVPLHAQGFRIDKKDNKVMDRTEVLTVKQQKLLPDLLYVVGKNILQKYKAELSKE